MVKSDHLELWLIYMEGYITLALTILDEHMRKMEIGRGGANNRDKDTIYPEIIELENYCKGELREVAAIVEGRDLFAGCIWFIY